MPASKPSVVLAPERLTSQHDLSEFRNGKHDSLDAWLRDRALASGGLSARTYVVCADEAPNRVVGYYAHFHCDGASFRIAQRQTAPRNAG